MSSRNRKAGSNYEEELVARFNSFGFLDKEGEFLPLFPKVDTTRTLSTKLDSMKVDIYTENPDEFKQLGLVIQAKSTTNTSQYPKLLKQMEPAVDELGGIPVVYHKQTQRTQIADSAPRFMTRGEYISMNARDFEDIYTQLKLYKEVHAELMTYYDSFPEEIQKDLNKYLTSRNL